MARLQSGETETRNALCEDLLTDGMSRSLLRSAIRRVERLLCIEGKPNDQTLRLALGVDVRSDVQDLFSALAAGDVQAAERLLRQDLPTLSGQCHWLQVQCIEVFTEVTLFTESLRLRGQPTLSLPGWLARQARHSPLLTAHLDAGRVASLQELSLQKQRP